MPLSENASMTLEGGYLTSRQDCITYVWVEVEYLQDEVVILFAVITDSTFYSQYKDKPVRHSATIILYLPKVFQLTSSSVTSKPQSGNDSTSP